LRTDGESRTDCAKKELGVLYFKPRFLTRMEACERCEKLQIRRNSARSVSSAEDADKKYTGR
jgi:hypothetical protein